MSKHLASNHREYLKTALRKQMLDEFFLKVNVVSSVEQAQPLQSGAISGDRIPETNVAKKLFPPALGSKVAPLPALP